MDGKVVEEFKLRVVYIPANPPSPVPEGSEEGSSPRASVHENGNQNTSLFCTVGASSGCFDYLSPVGGKYITNLVLTLFHTKKIIFVLGNINFR